MIISGVTDAYIVTVPFSCSVVSDSATLSITNSQSLFKLMSIELVMPSNHLILCCPLFLPPSIFPSIRVFSNESVLRIRWPKYCSFIFSISPSNEYLGLISFRMTGWVSLLSKGLSRVFSSTTVQKPLKTVSVSSAQFSPSVMSDSLRPHGLQHTRLPCRSLSPRICSNSCPLS